MAKKRRPARKKNSGSTTRIGSQAGGTLPGLSRLMEHDLVFLLFLALISLSLVGAESPFLTGLLGLVLCLAGLGRKSIQIDPWILIPLIIYQAFSFTSFILTSNGITASMVSSFVTAQGFYLLIWLLVSILGDTDRLLLRQLCVLWAGCVACVGLVQFTIRALDGRTARIGGIFGNPNALGAFLVIGWFLLQSCENGKEWKYLARLEPLLLGVLALTLSMGSFLAMAVGILVQLFFQIGRRPKREILNYACNLLARASFGIGWGVLTYVAARRSGQTWMCIPLLLYLLAMILLWDQVRAFLQDVQKAAAVLTALGVLVAAVTILIRPSSFATFRERLEMMRNGVGYLTVHPLCGLGPYQWRVWNMFDSDTYFNTYHIHNALLHIGVEMGIPAMLAAATIVFRRFSKKGDPAQTAGYAAFVAHNMIDTSFFYPGVTLMVLMTESMPGKRRLPTVAAKLLFVAHAVLFLAYMYGERNVIHVG